MTTHGDDLDRMIAEFNAEHPWAWRRQRVRSWTADLIGKRLPFLCRHPGTVGPAGEDFAWCLYCDRKVDCSDDGATL